MNTLVRGAGRTPGDFVTLSVSVDGSRGVAVRDQATLEHARELIAQAVADGPDKPAGAKAVKRAAELLLVGGRTLEQREVGALMGLDGTTVSKYRTRSLPGGSMESHPFPKAEYENARAALWMVDQVPDLVVWLANRPGRGAGGGRPWHADEQPNPDLLVGLPRDLWTVDHVLQYMEGIGHRVGRTRLLRLRSEGLMPEEEGRTSAGMLAWKPATIRKWHPAPKGVVKR